jgi:hypothetical protein
MSSLPGSEFMQYIKMLLCAVTIAASLFADEPRYIGSDKCARMCHRGPKKGSQLEIWEKSPHARAYKTMGTAESKEVAKKAGVTGDPQKAPECLRCHVTAYGVKKELVEPTCTYEEGVGCEACHGPGSEYRSLNKMKQRDLAVASGLVLQNEAVCVRCHNPESPTYKPFNYDEAVKESAHPLPKKEK